MSYLDKSLADGEEIVYRGRWPLIHWIGAWAALILLGIIIVGIFIFIRSVIIMTTTQFGVTTQRVVLKRGWLNVRTQELATESVEGVSVQQSIWGKLFGYGHIYVTGTGDARIAFPPMAHPIQFRRAIESVRVHGEEVHLSPEDSAAIREAAHADDRVERDEDDGPRRKRRSSFIGLGAR